METGFFTKRLILLSFLLFVACHMDRPPAPDTLRVVINAEPDTLNPITATDAYSSRILDYVNDTLIERDRDTLQYKPKLAESWEVSADHLRYVFHLRPHVTWHDGVPFSADDVVFSFQKITDPKVEAPSLRVYYSDVAKVEKIDDLTVVFFYKKPYFMGLSVCGTIPLVPKHLFKEGDDFNVNSIGRHPVGLGPYRFVEWKTNKKIVLERYDHYWGEKPEIKTMEFRIVTDDAVAFQVLKKGDLDFTGIRPIQWMRQTQSEKFNSLFGKYKYLLPGYSYIGWNMKSPFFADKRVRQAMTFLIDRQKLLEKINFGLGQVIESPFFINSLQYNRSLQPHVLDVEQSRKLFAEAGWIDSDRDGWLDKDGKKFSFVFLYPSGSKFSERVAPILKEDLKKMGIDMNIERMEWAAFLDRIDRRNFDATALGWSTGFEDDPYQVWHSSQAKEAHGSNFVSFENKEADRLMEEARSEFDEAKRKILYDRLQAIIYEEQPYTFLFSSDSLVVVSRRFENVEVHKTGMNVLEWKVKP